MSDIPEYVLRARLRCWKCKYLWTQTMPPPCGVECPKCHGEYITWLNHPYVVANPDRWARCKEFIERKK